MAEMMRFFDERVPFHGALRAHKGDLRPLLYAGMRSGKISASDLEEIGGIVKTSIEKRGTLTPRMQWGINEAFIHAQQKRFPEALSELRSAFFWSNPDNLRKLERHFRSNGINLTLGRELLSQTAHVFSGNYKGKRVVVKLTVRPPLHPTVERHIVQVPVAHQLYESPTPFIPGHLSVVNHLPGKIAVKAIEDGAPVMATFHNMGKALAKIHSNPMTPQLRRLFPVPTRLWRPIAQETSKDVSAIATAFNLDSATVRKISRVLNTKLKEPSACVLHNDFHEENILVDEAGNVSGVIDFQGAKFGDPMSDLAKAMYYARKTEELYGFKGASIALRNGYHQEKPLSADAKVRLNHFYLATAISLATPYLNNEEVKPTVKKLLLEALKRIS